MFSFHQDLHKIQTALIKSFQDPIENIKELPQWNWQTLLIFHLVFSFAVALIGLLLHQHPLKAMLYPIQSLVILMITGFFIQYSLILFINKKIIIESLATLLVFAQIPFAVLHMGAVYLPPLDLVGLAFSCILTAVGLAENFSVDKPIALKLVGSGFSIFFIVWIVAQI